MISWIQVTFQKHTKLIFLFLLLVMAIPFVITIGSTPGIGRAGHKILERPFFNYNLASQEDQRRIGDDAQLSIYLQAGYLGASSEQIQEYGFQRVAALSLANAYGIPAPSEKELTDHLEKLPAFMGSDGKFDPKRYSDFVDSLKTNPQVSRGDLARVLSEDVRIEEVDKIVSGPGYVLPAEVRGQVERAMTEWTISVASTDFAAFKPDVPVNELSLSTYFDNNAARYRMPQRVSVDYVVFKPGAYEKGVTFTDADLLAFYKANPSRFPTPADDKDKKTEDAATDAVPPSVRASVETALRNERASKVAARTASDFTYAIFDQKIARDSSALDDLIASYKVTREKAPPFTEKDPPKGLGWNTTITQEAFKLGDDRYFSDPLALADGSLVVLFWNQTLPASTPELASVRDAVVRDFTESERHRLFVEDGAKWRAELQAKLGGGMTLEAAAAAIANPKFEVVSYPAFSRRKPPEKIDPAVLSTLEETQQGQLSGFTVSGDKGLLVDVVSKKLPNLDPSSPDYSQARAQLSRMSASLTQNVVLSGLVERELSKFPDVEP